MKSVIDTDDAQGGTPAALVSTPRVSRRCVLRAFVGGCGALALGGVACAQDSARLEVSRHRVVLELPRPVRLVGVSDLHVDGDTETQRRLVELVSAERPDLIAIVGDTIDHRKGRETREVIELLESFDAPLGVYATLGNWDRDSIGDVDELRRIFDRAGARLLVEEATEVAGLRIVGVDDVVLGRPDPMLAARHVGAGPALVLSHCPSFFDDLRASLGEPSAAPRSLTLSGHTHGGQVAPFGVAVFTPAGSGGYVAGWYGDERTGLYVMRGIGYSGPRIRIGSHPEVSVIELI